jgi:hypothetical protein
MSVKCWARLHPNRLILFYRRPILISPGPHLCPRMSTHSDKIRQPYWFPFGEVYSTKMFVSLGHVKSILACYSVWRFVLLNETEFWSMIVTITRVVIKMCCTYSNVIIKEYQELFSYSSFDTLVKQRTFIACVCIVISTMSYVLFFTMFAQRQLTLVLTWSCYLIYFYFFTYRRCRCDCVTVRNCTSRPIFQPRDVGLINRSGIRNSDICVSTGYNSFTLPILGFGIVEKASESCTHTANE